jgi:ATP-dependent RNA helicase HelY
MKSDRIKNWPKRERPRERLLAEGANRLTDDRARKYGESETDESVRKLMAQVASAWVSGTQLHQIERIFSRPRTRIPPKCGRIRMAILKWLPDVAYVAAIIRSLYPIAVPHAPIPICLQILQRSLRLGVDSPEKLAFMHVRNYILMRVVCHREFDSLQVQIPGGQNETDFGDVIRRVARAVRQTE